jgi:Tfp pilus assembly protein PilF
MLVTLGAARSWSRQAVWRDNDTLFSQSIADSPRSYRAWFVYGRDLLHRSRPAEAKARYARAAELWDRDRRVFEDWGFILGTEGRCDLAVPVLERGVAAEPRETLARSRMFECLLKLRRFTDARMLAEVGVALGNTEFAAGVRRARALEDAANASPGSSPDSAAGTPADPH